MTAATLNMLAQRVRPGGIVYLNDPTLEGMARVQQLVQDLAVSSWRNTGRVTPGDISVVATINSGHLTQAAGAARPTFHTPAQLRALAEAAGFEIIRARPSYGGACYELVLRRLGQSS